MANVQGPFGFRPIQSQNTSGYTGKTMEVLIRAADTNAYFVGDMIKLTGQQDEHVIDGRSYPVATKAAAADTKLQGAITGIKAQELRTNQYAGYRPAGAQQDAILVMVPVDRNCMYVCQEDSDGGALSKDNVGKNIDFVVGAGNIGGRTSTSAIDSDTVNSTAALPLRLISYDAAIDNESGDYANWVVTINQDLPHDTTGIV